MMCADYETAVDGIPAKAPVSKYQRDPEALLRRLRRIEGQVRGIQRMVENDRYCVDILHQIAAVKAAMDQVSLSLLHDHTHGCVAKAVQQGEGDAVIDEMLDVVKRLLK